MVTWGANTVHDLGGGGSAAASTNQTAVGGFAFGTSTISNNTNTTLPSATNTTTTNTTNTAATSTGGGLFGTTNPTPAAVPGLFGSSTPTPAPPTITNASSGGGLFGSSSFFGAATPAPLSSSGGLFGTTPATTNNTNSNPSSLFGGSSSLFGNTTNPSSGSSLFGSPAPTFQQPQQLQQQPPQIPAHAALQAHMNAYARNEEARVMQRMQTIYQTYTGTSVATDGKSHCFSIPLYNPITEQQRQIQEAMSTIVMTTNQQGFMVSSALVAPPKPPQICEEDWKLACIRNPDANHFIPTAVVGADSLLARAILHQQQCNTVQQHLTKIQEAMDHIQQRHGEMTRLLESATEQHQKQCTRLLKIMKAVEVGRCFNIPLQPAEMEAFQRIRNLKYGIIEEQLVPEVLKLTNPQQQDQPPLSNNNKPERLLLNHSETQSKISIPLEQQQMWMTILKEHRSQLGTLTNAIQKEQEDLQLLHDRVIGTTTTTGRLSHPSPLLVHPPHRTLSQR